MEVISDPNIDSLQPVDEVMVLTSSNSDDPSERVEINTEKETDKLTKLPLARIKYIMKLDPDLSLTSQESVVLMAKATELFIESLTKEAYLYTVKGKKKTIQKRDLEAAIETTDSLCFLEGTLD